MEKDMGNDVDNAIYSLEFRIKGSRCPSFVRS